MVIQKRDEFITNYQTTNIEYPIKPKDEPRYIERNNNSYYQVGTEKPHSSNKRAVFAQCVVAGAVLIILTGCGMPIGYSAILLPQLSNNNTTIHIDKELGSWIASVHSLAVPMAGIFSGLLLDAIGRRACLQLATIPLFLGWIVMGFSTSVPYILTGRIVLGFAVGLIPVPAQVLTGETSNAKLRGMLSGTGLTAYTIGILLVYSLGAYFSWDIVAFSCTIMPLIAVICLCFIPESPVWLVRRNKIEEAKKALMWLRGDDIAQVNSEVAILEYRAKADMAQKCETTSFLEKVASAGSMLKNRGVLKPLIIINIFNLLQQFSGTYIVVFYGVDIVKKIGGENLDTGLAAITTAFVRFVSSFISCFLLLNLGRRTLSIISSLGTALACFALAGFLLTRQEESPNDIYIVTACLLAYVGFNTVGLFSLPIIMLTELLPPRARGFIGGCTYSLFNFILFGVTKAFPTIDDKIGMVGVFILFGSSAILLIIFTYFLLPETKNQTLEEIEDYFQQDNILWITREQSKDHKGSKKPSMQYNNAV